MRHRSSAFTLVELLTVIAIIGILAAILIPTAGAVRASANKARAKAQFSQWALAMVQFRQEYGYYPNVTPSATERSGLIEPSKFFGALTGRDHEGARLSGAALHGNTRAISFYAVGDAELVKNDAGVAQNILVDAFGNEQIVVMVDADGDGVISGAELNYQTLKAGNTIEGMLDAPAPNAADFPPGGIRGTVVFYSAGRGTSAADYVLSWK